MAVVTAIGEPFRTVRVHAFVCVAPLIQPANLFPHTQIQSVQITVSELVERAYEDISQPPMCWSNYAARVCSMYRLAWVPHDIAIDGEILDPGNVIGDYLTIDARGVVSPKLLLLEVVMGPRFKPEEEINRCVNEGVKQLSTRIRFFSLELKNADDYLLVDSYDIDTIALLSNIPSFGADPEDDLLNQLLVNIELDDFYGAMQILEKLPTDGRPFREVMVKAYFSANKYSCQYAGSHSTLVRPPSDNIGEQRIVPMLELPDLRGYYHIGALLRNYDMRSKSGLSTHFRLETPLRSSEVSEVLLESGLSEDLINLVQGYTDPWYPNQIDTPSLELNSFIYPEWDTRYRDRFTSVRPDYDEMLKIIAPVLLTFTQVRGLRNPKVVPLLSTGFSHYPIFQIGEGSKGLDLEWEDRFSVPFGQRNEKRYL